MLRTIHTLTLLLLLVLPVHAQDAARALVEGFYKDYQAVDQSWSKVLPGQKDHFSNELYELLNDCVDNTPQDSFWLDFDPFLNAQMNAATIKVETPTEKGSLWYVPVKMSYRSPGNDQLAMHVVVGYNEDKLRILNFVYPARDGTPSWDLKSFLKKGLGK